MFIKRTSKVVRGKTYFNYLLVESVATPKGPRHRVVCSLGSLEPAPAEQWLALAHRLELSLTGQEELTRDEKAEAILNRIHSHPSKAHPRSLPSVVAVRTDQVTTERAREAGPVHVGHQMWKKLDLDSILAEAGLNARARLLTEVMTLNRLIAPSSELAMPDWIRRTALEDILKVKLDTLNEDALYRNLDRLHPQREGIERGLAKREGELFNLDSSIYLYDLTSTYFEGKCLQNPQAKRGYSRDHRPDCKQVVVGLVLDREAFPKAHEVFDGNRVDHSTVDDMLACLEKRVGIHPGATVVVDRGMAYDQNLKQIRARDYHYIVASLQGERNEHLEEFEDESGWQEVVREPSPTNPAQKKTRVVIKRCVVGEELHVLCLSDGRKEKDRAIREKHEARLLADLKKLEARILKGSLAAEARVYEAIGRLKERYSRVARYYEISYDARSRILSWKENAEKKEKATHLDGGYVLKTDRKDLSDDEIWRIYILLTRVEAAFRDMKSPLMERPIFHHLKDRVQTHIFLCVLAYHLLVSIEKMHRDRKIHTSWETLRAVLATHQVVTVVLPTTSGVTLRIRKGTTPEQHHREIYRTLGIPEEVMTPLRTVSDG